MSKKQNKQESLDELQRRSKKDRSIYNSIEHVQKRQSTGNFSSPGSLEDIQNRRK